jgi:hypothetical protein
VASIFLAVKMNNGKLAGKLGSVRINNNNIFHRCYETVPAEING